MNESQPSTQGQRSRLIQKPATERIEPYFRVSRLLKSNLYEAEETLDAALEKVRYAEAEAAAILDRAMRDAERIRYDAHREGYQDGAETAAKDISSLQSAIIELRNCLEHEIRSVALDLASSVLRTELTLNKQAVETLVIAAVNRARFYESITILLNPAVYCHVADMEEGDFGSSERDSAISLRADDSIPVGDVVVETEMGSFSISMNSRLDQAASRHLADSSDKGGR